MLSADPHDADNGGNAVLDAETLVSQHVEGGPAQIAGQDDVHEQIQHTQVELGFLVSRIGHKTIPPLLVFSQPCMVEVVNSLNHVWLRRIFSNTKSERLSNSKRIFESGWPHFLGFASYREEEQTLLSIYI